MIFRKSYAMFLYDFLIIIGVWEITNSLYDNLTLQIRNAFKVYDISKDL